MCFNATFDEDCMMSLYDLLTMHTLKNTHSQIISIMSNTIYQEQHKLAPALRHAF